MKKKYTKVLRTIVCGYERGGTTVLSSVLSQHPKLASGFESGLLLAPCPADFLKSDYDVYNGSLIKNGWKISDKDIHYICSAPNWNQAYLRLRERSMLIKDKNILLYDKTPKYMKHLNDILIREDEIKAIVIIKQPAGVLWSWIKRRDSYIPLTNLEIKIMCERYLDYSNGYKKAIHNHPNRILSIKYSEFCRNPIEKTKEMCDFVDLEFHDTMVNFNPQYGVYQNTVNDYYINEYKDNLTNKQIDFINQHTHGVFSGY